MPQPSIPTPSIEFQGLNKFLKELETGVEIQAGVASKGEAAAYSLVWEYGNVRQTKEGPKTVKGVNPDGEVVWLSVQAPSGYIAINENMYHEILKQELAKVTFQGTTAVAIRKELEAAAIRTMERCKKIIKETAPVDEGTLADSFYVVKPNDPLLKKDKDYTLDLGV